MLLVLPIDSQNRQFVIVDVVAATENIKISPIKDNHYENIDCLCLSSPPEHGKSSKGDGGRAGGRPCLYRSGTITTDANGSETTWAPNGIHTLNAEYLGDPSLPNASITVTKVAS